MKKNSAKNTKPAAGGGRGGARANAGRKSADVLGLEKKQQYPAYLYPTHFQELLKYFPSVTVACEWAMEQKRLLSNSLLMKKKKTTTADK